MPVVELEKTMEREYGNWNLGWKVYGTIYILVRLFLIVASSVVSAKAALATEDTETLVRWVPVLALLVTIFTALDTWIKPQQKWQGFMKDRDDLQALITRLKDDEPDPAEAAAIREEFNKLRERHRKENVY